MDSYFTDRPSLKLILLLIDSRHPPSQEDLSFAEWISHHNYPFLIVFTKTDKVKPGVLQKQIDQSFAELQRAMKGSSTASLAYSIHEPKPRIVLEKLIEEYISWD